jgi:hypothetical protein
MSFWERMDEVVNQGLESSREILSKARDKGVLSANVRG